jgi:hypothetical protein
MSKELLPEQSSLLEAKMKLKMATIKTFSLMVDQPCQPELYPFNQLQVIMKKDYTLEIKVSISSSCPHAIGFSQKTLIHIP